MLNEQLEIAEIVRTAHGKREIAIGLSRLFAKGIWEFNQVEFLEACGVPITVKAELK